MIRTFFRDSLFYTLSTLLTRGLGFILLPFYTHVLTPEDYGVLDYLTILGSVLAVTVTLDLGQGLARYIPELREDAHRLRAFASTGLWFTVCNYTALFLAIVVFKSEIAELVLGSPAFGDVLVIAAGLYWVNSISNVVQSQLRWELRSLQSSLVSMLHAVVGIAFSALFLLYFRWGVPGALFGQILGGVAAITAGFVLTRERYRLTFDWSDLRTMLAFSIPLVPSSLGVMVAMYVDRLAIKRLMTLSDVGLYGVGNRVALIVSLAMVGFQGALTPLIYAHHQAPTTPGELARLFRLFATASLVLIAGLALFSDPLIALIAPPTYRPAAAVVPYLAGAAVFSSLYIFAPGLELQKRTGAIALINIGVALVNVALNFTLIPSLGLVGAALGTLLSAFLGVVVRMIWSQRLYLVPHSWHRLLGAAALTSVLAWIALKVDLGGWQTLGLRSTALLLITGLLVKMMVVDRTERAAQLPDGE